MRLPSSLAGVTEFTGVPQTETITGEPRAMSDRSGWQLASETVAEAYERYIMAAFGNAWTQALVQLADPEDGDRGLDVACGTGAVARYIAPVVGPTGQVTGLDLNVGMLAGRA